MAEVGKLLEKKKKNKYQGKKRRKSKGKNTVQKAIGKKKKLQKTEKLPRTRQGY